MLRGTDPTSASRLSQVLSVEQMRGAEQALIDAGETVDSLMQVAGRGAGEWVRRLAADRPVTVLCGPGNNGGDGWVIARHLLEHGNPVQVIPARDPATGAARNARAAYSGPVLSSAARPQGEVLVDCLFGSGLTRALPEDLLLQLQALANGHRQRIAIDVPSGIESDSGTALNEGLPAWDMTIALGAWKFAHLTLPAAATMGVLRLVDIGVDAVPGAAQVLPRPGLQPPAIDAHKYTRGLGCVIGGAMPGAAMLASQAAMRSGAGYIKLVVQRPPEGVPPDLVVETAGDIPAMMRIVADRRAKAVLVGPGLGRDDRDRLRLAALLSSQQPAVLDADALMLLSPRLLPRHGADLVLTPHEGEMVSLELRFGLPGGGARRERAAALASLSRAVVVLKGPDTVIAAPDGRVALSPRQSSWLSMAGTGDVLAGITLARLAVTGDPFRAACEAVWLHGRAAELAGPAFTAMALASMVPAAMAQGLA